MTDLYPYLAMLLLGLVGGFVICLPWIMILEKRLSVFTGKRERDAAGRFVGRG